METEILVELFGSDVDAEQLDEMTLAVRRELLELDVEGVAQATAGPAPAGSRGLELATIGALLVQVEASTELVAKIVGVLKGWLTRSPKANRSLRLTVDGQTIELSNATEAQQQQLVDQFVQSIAGD